MPPKIKWLYKASDWFGNNFMPQWYNGKLESMKDIAIAIYTDNYNFSIWSFVSLLEYIKYLWRK